MNSHDSSPNPPSTSQTVPHAPGTKNIPHLEGLPIPHLTANLRFGENLHDGLLAFLPLVGVWRGHGQGYKLPGSKRSPHSDEVSSLGEDFEFGQELTISHDGNNYLRWSSVIWEITDVSAADTQTANASLSSENTQADGEETVKPSIYTREEGFLRITADDDIELLLTHSDGFVEIYYGTPRTATSWELTTDAVLRASSAAPVGGAQRLYGLVNEGDLAYVEERIGPNSELTPVFSAQLTRYAG